MNLELLNKYFKTETIVASTGNTLIAPSSLTKEVAKDLVEKLPMGPILNGLAAALAKAVGTQLLTGALRPADYQNLRELPDALIEHLIEELAKKPDVFFKVFQDTLKIQG